MDAKEVAVTAIIALVTYAIIFRMRGMTPGGFWAAS